MDNNKLLQAVSNYQSALNFRPSTKTLYNLALSYYWLSDFKKAKSTLQILLNTTPRAYDAKQLLAGIYLSIGELKPAIVMYEDIIKLNPQSNELDNLGLAYTLAGRYQEAFKMAKLAMEFSPNHPTKILNFADAQMILGFTKEAKLNYQRVIEIQTDKQSVKSWLERSQAYTHLGQHQLAIKALNQAKKLAPNNGEVAFAAALVYSLLNEQVSAVSQVEEALTAGFGLIWFNLPWFNSLCSSTDFQEILTKAGTPKRCQLES
jgi:serine/threonine-protein kinase